MVCPSMLLIVWLVLEDRADRWLQEQGEQTIPVRWCNRNALTGRLRSLNDRQIHVRSFVEETRTTWCPQGPRELEPSRVNACQILYHSRHSRRYGSGCFRSARAASACWKMAANARGSCTFLHEVGWKLTGGNMKSGRQGAQRWRRTCFGQTLPEW